jgi:hypothetical protein
MVALGAAQESAGLLREAERSYAAALAVDPHCAAALLRSGAACLHRAGSRDLHAVDLLPM